MDQDIVLDSAINYLHDGGDEDAAKVLQVCSLSYRVVNFYFQIGGDDKLNGVLIDLACPRVVYEVLHDHAHPLTKAIIDALKACLPTDYTYENLVAHVEYTRLDTALQAELQRITQAKPAEKRTSVKDEKAISNGKPEPVDSLKQLFKPAALEQIARILGEQYRGWEIANLFGYIGFPQYKHDGQTARWYFALRVLVEIQSSNEGARNIIKIIELLCDPQRYTNQPEVHEDILKRVDEILRPYNFTLNENCKVVARQNGKLVVADELNTAVDSSKTGEAKLFDARDFHTEIKRHGQPLFLQGQYFHAVFECCKAFDKYVQKKSKLDNLSGSGLMSAAFSVGKGRLRLSTLNSETERDEQEGLMHLCMGLINAIRNPGGHEPALDRPMSREDALDVLSLISFLYRQVDKTHYVSP